MSDQSLQFQVGAAVCQLVGSDHCRLDTYGRDSLPATNLIPDDESTEPEDGLDDANDFKFHLRFIVAMPLVAEGEDQALTAHATADRLFVTADRLIAANRTLGGLVRSVRRVGRTWQMEQEALQQIALVATYECKFSTRQLDPAAPGY